MTTIAPSPIEAQQTLDDARRELAEAEAEYEYAAASNHNFFRLRAFILKHSVSQDWPTARLEWQLNDVEDRGKDHETCPCGYEPIRYLCWLLNTKNRTLVFVGNVCVNRFLPEHDINNVVNGLRRIQRDPTRAPNSALLTWARKTGVITQWEYNFGKNTMGRRNLSPRQWQKRRQINARIQARLVATRRGAVLLRPRTERRVRAEEKKLEAQLAVATQERIQ